ncbi:hypothetical protein DFH09DRAFT_1079193 [Mycena vulgaris]|nr:hypothetical protein DFH09DRAFT_1079193 [Mycena vulgaris]
MYLREEQIAQSTFEFGQAGMRAHSARSTSDSVGSPFACNGNKGQNRRRDEHAEMRETGVGTKGRWLGTSQVATRLPGEMRVVARNGYVADDGLPQMCDYGNAETSLVLGPWGSACLGAKKST